MAERQNRYKKMESYMTYTLIAEFILFIIYLIAAGNAVIWLKVTLAILIFAISAACLAYLYLTKEMLKRRSVWMTAAAAAMALCLLFSLILNFPSPNPHKTSDASGNEAYVAILDESNV